MWNGHAIRGSNKGKQDARGSEQITKRGRRSARDKRVRTRGTCHQREVDRERLAEHDQADHWAKNVVILDSETPYSSPAFSRCKSHHGGIGAVEAGHDVGHLIGINAAEATHGA